MATTAGLQKAGVSGRIDGGECRPLIGRGAGWVYVSLRDASKRGRPLRPSFRNSLYRRDDAPAVDLDVEESPTGRRLGLLTGRSSDGEAPGPADLAYWFVLLRRLAPYAPSIC